MKNSNKKLVTGGSSAGRSRYLTESNIDTASYPYGLNDKKTTNNAKHGFPLGTTAGGKTVHLKSSVLVVGGCSKKKDSGIFYALNKLKKDNNVSNPDYYSMLKTINPDREIKLIHCMVENELYFDYIPVLHEKEKVIYKDGNLFVRYEDQEVILDISYIVSLQKDKLYKERESVKFTMEEAKAALYDSDNPKYRMLFVQKEDLVDISFEEFKNILTKYGTGSFSYHAYKTIN